MDRQIVWAGAIPLETDLLNTNKNVMIAIGKLAQAILGNTTTLNGLACTPTSPASMQVNVAPGEIYMSENVDNSAYSSLAADTAHQIIKQGIMLNAATLSCPAPATSGQSINYLVEATLSEVDGNNTVLPFYNASNPATAWSGPANSGNPSSTTRQTLCIVQVKAGTAEATGSQVTPAPDAGYVGVWVVTVAYGQSTILAGNIALYPGAPFLTSNLSGVSTAFAALNGSASQNFSTAALTASGLVTADAGLAVYNSATLIYGGSGVAATGNGYLQIGPSSGANVVYDNASIQGRYNGGVSALQLNPLGGSVSTKKVTLDDGSGNAAIPGTLLLGNPGSLISMLLVANSSGAEIQLQQNLGATNTLTFNSFNGGVVPITTLTFNATDALFTGKLTTNNNTLDDGAGNAFFYRQLTTYGFANITAGLTVTNVAPIISAGTSVALTGNGNMQIGISTGYNLIQDPKSLQARNNGAISALNLNPLGGSVLTKNNTLDDGVGNASFLGTITAATANITGSLTATGTASAAAATTSTELVNLGQLGNGTVQINSLDGLLLTSSQGSAYLYTDSSGTGAANDFVIRVGAAGAYQYVQVSPAGAFSVPGTASAAAATTAANLVNLGQFPANVTGAGYQKLPTGLIIQWGWALCSIGSATTVNFPITFPTSMASVTATPSGISSAELIASITSFSVSLVNIALVSMSSTTGSVSVGWIALGY